MIRTETVKFSEQARKRRIEALESLIDRSRVGAHACNSNTAGEFARLISGRYVDRLERRDGEWKIALRRTTVDVLSTGTAAMLKSPMFVDQGYAKGLRGRNDIFYQRPLNLDGKTERW